MINIPNKLREGSVKCFHDIQLLNEKQALKILARKLSDKTESRNKKNDKKENILIFFLVLWCFPTLTHPGLEVLITVGTELHFLIFVLSVIKQKYSLDTI